MPELAVKVIALVFFAAFFVFCFFPTATPAQPDTMNWNIVMFGKIFLWATGFYVVKGRKMYIPSVRIVNEISSGCGRRVACEGVTEIKWR